MHRRRFHTAFVSSTLATVTYPPPTNRLTSSPIHCYNTCWRLHPHPAPYAPATPSASRLRRNTEDPALPPPPRPPRAAVNIYHHVHTWPLPLATWWTPSHPSYLPTSRPADILGEPLAGRFAQLRKNTAHALQTLGKSGRSLGSTACMRWLNSTTLCQLCANCQQHTR